MTLARGPSGLQACLEESGTHPWNLTGPCEQLTGLEPPLLQQIPVGGRSTLWCPAVAWHLVVKQPQVILGDGQDREHGNDREPDCLRACFAETSLRALLHLSWPWAGRRGVPTEWGWHVSVWVTLPDRGDLAPHRDRHSWRGPPVLVCLTEASVPKGPVERRCGGRRGRRRHFGPILAKTSLSQRVALSQSLMVTSCV